MHSQSRACKFSPTPVTGQSRPGQPELPALAASVPAGAQKVRVCHLRPFGSPTLPPTRAGNRAVTARMRLLPLSQVLALSLLHQGAETIDASLLGIF